jgi:hypothetical protein
LSAACSVSVWRSDFSSCGGGRVEGKQNVWSALNVQYTRDIRRHMPWRLNYSKKEQV